jgi:hypothetical protein
MTPEGRVKAKVKLALRDWFQYWPVPSGFGKQMVDCIAITKMTPPVSLVYAIECKREGVTKPTPRQAAIMREMRKAGVKTYVVTMRNGELVWLEQKD